MQTVQQLLEQQDPKQLFIRLKEFYPDISPALQREMFKTFFELLALRVEGQKHSLIIRDDKVFLEDGHTSIVGFPWEFTLGCNIEDGTSDQAVLILRDLFAKKLADIGVTRAASQTPAIPTVDFNFTSSDRRFLEARQIIELLQKAGYEAVFTGGCVRDILTGKPLEEIDDFDIATSAHSEDIQKALADYKQLEVGKSFGVVIVIGETGTQFEVASFRKDGQYSDGRHPQEIEYCDMADDAKRRDLTINAIFYDPVAGKLYDFVEGLDDIKAKKLRFVGAAQDRIAEDKLRMLRYFRFVARGYNWQLADLEYIRDHFGEIKDISQERITDELTKIMRGGDQGIVLMFRQGLMPTLLGSSSEEINARQGLLSMFANNYQDNLISWAILSLFMDKPQVETLVTDFRLSRDFSQAVMFLHDNLEVVNQLADYDRYSRYQIATNPEFPRLLKLLELYMVTEVFAQGYFARIYSLINGLTEDIPRLVTGEDLQTLGFKQGKLLGEVLEDVYEKQINEEVTDKQILLDVARAKLPSVTPEETHD